MGESKQELDYRIVGKIMCSCEGSYASEGSEKEAFKDVLTWMHRSNEQGLCKPKINLLLRKLCAWGVTTHHDTPNKDHPVI